MAKKKVAAKAGRPAGKKGGGVNKSQAIRDYKAKHPKAGPTEITKALAKEGIKISPALVSNVTAAKKRKAKKTTKRKTATSLPASDKVSLSALVDAANFAEKVGGTEQAKKLLNAVAKIGEK